MAVVMIMEWNGVTTDQYDEAFQVVDWVGNQPPGGLFHVASHDGQSLRVVDVWESAEQFRNFVEQRLMPGVQQIGIQGEPKVEIYPTHRIFTPGYTAKAELATANGSARS